MWKWRIIPGWDWKVSWLPNEVLFAYSTQYCRLLFPGYFQSDLQCVHACFVLRGRGSYLPWSTCGDQTQLVGVGSLLSLHGFWELNSDHQTWQQEPLPEGLRHRRGWPGMGTLSTMLASTRRKTPDTAVGALWNITDRLSSFLFLLSPCSHCPYLTTRVNPGQIPG